MTLTDVRPDAVPRVRRALWSAPAGLMALAMTLRLVLLLRLPLSPDEGGFLIVGSQWSPGSSLYGHYWVDRPPLLIGFFAVADALGGRIALRLLGVLLVGLAVATAARIGQLAAPVGSRRRSATVGALVAATFLSTPLFGVGEVNGELVGASVLLVGMAAYLDGLRARGARRTTALLLAGSAAASAALVKQNQVDLVVLVLVAAVTTLRSLPGAPRRAQAIGLPALGAGITTVLVLGFAATRGTSPYALWQAVVVFRFHASKLIATQATTTTHARLGSLLLALLLSGAPMVAAALLMALRGRPRAGALDLRGPAAALLAWESVSVLAGGSYWLHYLICFVPGLVLAAVVTGLGRPPARWLAVPALGYAAVATAVALAAYTLPLERPTTPPVLAWLQLHTHPGETAVIAFGNAEYLSGAGLVSPYSELWSLPTRVRDPHLAEFTSLLLSPQRPCVIVTDPNGLPGWGLDASRAVPVLGAYYHRVADVDSFPIYEADACATALP